MEYQKLQTDLSNVVDSRQRLDAQLSENELVKKVYDKFTVTSTWLILILPLSPGICSVDLRECCLQADWACPCETRPDRGKEQRRYTSRFHSGRNVRLDRFP